MPYKDKTTRNARRHALHGTKKPGPKGKNPILYPFCRLRRCHSRAIPGSVHCPVHTRRFGTSVPPTCEICGMYARRDSKDGKHKTCRKSPK